MSVSMDHAELELTIRALGDGQHAADLQLRHPGSVSETDLTIGAPVALDIPHLVELSLDYMEYSRALTAQFFASSALREAWATLRGYIQGANTTLRIRLRIDLAAEPLHTVRWELLQDPFSHAFLCQSERVLFARYLDTDDLAKITAPALADIRALVAVANPSDLNTFNLAQVDVRGEVTRTRSALGDIPLSVLAGSVYGPRATLSRILDGLRAGYPILYLVCHGTMLNGASHLWLENEDGTTNRVAGETLVARIADLSPELRPQLIVLASCQSSGRDDAAAVLSALAPRLARVGVDAVIGMQGAVPMALVERLMARLFALLRVDGQIDRALALARADLPPTMHWWLPVLFMRVRNGQLWRIASDTIPAPPVDPVPRVAEGLDALLGLSRNPIVREMVIAFRSDFLAARAQVGDLIVLKDVHDLLHTLQFQCYIPLTREVRGFPDDELAIEGVNDYTLTLRTRTAEIREAFERNPETLGAGEWIAGLEAAHESLTQALALGSPKALRQGLWQINRVLAVQPSFINANLIARARGLRLRVLVEAMETLRSQLDQVSRDRVRLARFEVGVAALIDLQQHLTELIGDHDAWQEVDREVRRITESLRHDTEELVFSWPDLKAHLLPLAVGEAAWAEVLRSEMTQLDDALQGSSSQRPTAVFQRCNRIIGERFFQVDVDLKRLCSHLRELGDPLSELERVLA